MSANQFSIFFAFNVYPTNWINSTQFPSDIILHQDTTVTKHFWKWKCKRAGNSGGPAKKAHVKKHMNKEAVQIKLQDVKLILFCSVGEGVQKKH